jgi:RNA:NAD 2'-phosphotransferase (TPT1/KptA family)
MTTRHGKRQDFRSPKDKVERYVKTLLQPMPLGFATPTSEGWVDIEALCHAVRNLGKRAVSTKYVQKVVQENASWQLSPDGSKARALNGAQKEEARYATPNEFMYITTTHLGASALAKGSLSPESKGIDAVVDFAISVNAEVVLKVYARRAETLGAKFYPTQRPEQLRATGVPLSCLTALRDRGIK